MYFREKHSPSGRVLQLLESYRNEENKPRHRVVVSLGGADLPKEEWTIVAKAVERCLYGRPDLLPPSYSSTAQRWIDRTLKRIELQGRWEARAKGAAVAERAEKEPVVDSVLVNRVTHTQTTSLGPELLGKHAWDRLEMPQLLERLGFNNAEAQAAAVSVINRLVDPVSENALPDWVSGRSIPDIMEPGIEKAKKDRYLRVSDKLLRKKLAIERHIRSWQKRLFNLERTVLLYDLSNTHFEGVCAKNPKAKRGKNKQKRDDCPQVVVGKGF